MQGPGRAPAPAPTRRKNGVALGSVAVVGWLLLTALAAFASWGYDRAVDDASTRWVDVFLGLVAVAGFCWLAAVIVFAVDTRIRPRTPTVALVAVGLLVVLVEEAWTDYLNLQHYHSLDAPAIDAYVSWQWNVLRLFLTAGTLVGGWVLARRTSPVCLIAAVVAGIGAALVWYLNDGVITVNWGYDVWPLRNLLLYSVPFLIICVGSCWVAVAIDKMMAGGRPAAGQR